MLGAGFLILLSCFDVSGRGEKRNFWASNLHRHGVCQDDTNGEVSPWFLFVYAKKKNILNNLDIVIQRPIKSNWSSKNIIGPLLLMLGILRYHSSSLEWACYLGFGGGRRYKMKVVERLYDSWLQCSIGSLFNISSFYTCLIVEIEEALQKESNNISKKCLSIFLN